MIGATAPLLPAFHLGEVVVAGALGFEAPDDAVFFHSPAKTDFRNEVI